LLQEARSVAPPVAAPSPARSAGAAPAELLLALLDEAKAEETVSIDLTGKSTIADTMIVTQGRSNRHVGAIAERLIQGLKDRGFGRVRVEGMPTCDWVLIDAGDAIVHVFRPEVRAFYNLEKMWSAGHPVERLVV
jgi:ribosome-associated protein